MGRNSQGEREERKKNILDIHRPSHGRSYENRLLNYFEFAAAGGLGCEVYGAPSR
jgi:hypothetical protein